MRVAISALSGAAALLLGWVLPIMYPELPHWVQYVLLSAAVIALVGASVLAFFHKEKATPPTHQGDYYDVRGAPGGNTFGRVENLNLGPRPFQLNDVAKGQVLAFLAGVERLPIKMAGLGGQRSMAAARELGDFLRQRGYDVLDEVDQVLQMFPPMEKPIQSNIANGQIVITVDAGMMV